MLSIQIPLIDKSLIIRATPRLQLCFEAVGYACVDEFFSGRPDKGIGFDMHIRELGATRKRKVHNTSNRPGTRRSHLKQHSIKEISLCKSPQRLVLRLNQHENRLCQVIVRHGFALVLVDVALDAAAAALNGGVPDGPPVRVEEDEGAGVLLGVEVDGAVVEVVELAADEGQVV